MWWCCFCILGPPADIDEINVDDGLKSNLSVKLLWQVQPSDVVEDIADRESWCSSDSTDIGVDDVYIFGSSNIGTRQCLEITMKPPFLHSSHPEVNPARQHARSSRNDGRKKTILQLGSVLSPIAATIDLATTIDLAISSLSSTSSPPASSIKRAPSQRFPSRLLRHLHHKAGASCYAVTPHTCTECLHRTRQLQSHVRSEPLQLSCHSVAS